MEELYSCRNCVHNAGQSLHIGRGAGFCIKHVSVLPQPEMLTCKYHHRKDLPHFVVDEGRSEHASEFAAFSGIVDIVEQTHVRRIQYSEKYNWDHGTYDPVNNALSGYHKAARSWVFIQAFAGGIDGRRVLTHGCLVRRYMDQCNRWQSSYRMVLALVEGMQNPASFEHRVLVDEDVEDARWDVFFVQLSGLQEYGWHAGVESLMWASDQVNGGLSSLDWARVENELSTACPKWINTIVNHAKDHGEFFTQVAESELDEGA